ncbi:MAG: carboxymuconolactone decarboxylase family protein, partial [Sciscionella sp.]
MARVPDGTADGPVAERIRARRSGQLHDLDRVLLHSPPVADGWNTFIGVIREGTTLPGDLRELAILRVAVLN